MIRKCPIVAIGASAGGLDALKAFFDSAPAGLGAAIVVIQHLDPSHQSMTADILARHTKMPTSQVKHGAEVEIDHVYVIAPNTSLTLKDNTFQLSQAIPQHGLRMPIDVFFTSLAAQNDRQTAGLILSGTGSDGTLGLREIKGAGGIVLAQTPQTAQFDGMPRAAIATGLVDIVCPVEEMPARIKDYLSHEGIKRITQTDEAALTPDDEAHLKSIIALLYARLGHDLRGYKKGTLGRRITRRMGLHNIENMPNYLNYLRENDKEVSDLYQDLLINVTSFFRDPDAFEALAANVIRPLVKTKEPGDHIRVWVAGCSTGEEAYSIGMLLIEELEAAHKDCQIQIFATDIDDQALAIGRSGIYSANLVPGVAAARLKRFFTQKDGDYQIKKELREQITFASQNVITDPPFSRLDLISCRNLLIYLEGNLQDKIIGYFHFALDKGGYLFLGRSESANHSAALFEPIDKKCRIFRKLPDVATSPINFPTHGMKTYAATTGLQPAPRPKESAHLRELMAQHLLRNYAPAAVLTNAKNQILYFMGPTADFLEQPSGLPTQDLLSLTPPELRKHLRAGLKKANETARELVMDNITVKRSGRAMNVQVTIRPMPAPGGTDPLFLVSFENISTTKSPAAPAIETRSQQSDVSDLETRLRDAQEDLQISLEELESTNEELQASNEEMMSVNEELQSANEELETSKEELQAMNEELSTVNNQLKDKVEQLANVNDDLKNFVASTGIATLMLDSNHRIGRFTPSANRLFNLIEADTGRPISDIRQKFIHPEFLQDIDRVFQELQPIEREVMSDAGACYLMRITPYRPMEHRPGGVVVTFVDITQRLLNEGKLRESEARFRNLVENAPDSLILVNTDGEIVLTNSEAQRFFGYDQEEMLGKKIESLLPKRFRKRHQTHRQKFLGDVKVRPMGSGLELLALTKNGDEIPIEVGLSPVITEDAMLICSAIRDIREHQKAVLAVQAAQEKAETAVGAKSRFLATASHDLRQPLQSLTMLTETLTQKVDDPELVEIVERQAASLANMRNLLNSLLDISRLDAGGMKIKIEKVSLRAAVTDVCANVQAEADRKGLKLTAAVHDRIVLSDKNLLQQILQNLIGNAIRYTKHGSVEVVSIVEGDQLRVEVRDTGVGIPANQLPHIFEEFYQFGRDPQEGDAGLGLGLAIVHRIAEKLDIQIQVKSKVGKGSVFSFRLPAGEALQPELKLADDETSASLVKGGVVLLIDDDASVLKSTKFRLSLYPNLEVFGAISPEEASAVLNEMGPKRPDIIVTDYHLGGSKNGIDVIEDVRARAGAQVPAVLLSGDTGLRAGKLKRRNIHLILKPTSGNELIDMMARLLS